MINIGTAHNIPQIVGLVQLGYINSYIRFFLLVVTLMVKIYKKNSQWTNGHEGNVNLLKNGKLDSHACCDCDHCCDPDECLDCYECCDSDEGCDSDECGDSMTE